MDPFFARNRLSAYLDGELPPEELRGVEEALQRDPGLRAELERLRATAALLREGGLVDPPPGFADRVRARVGREPIRAGWSRWLHGRTAEALALAAVALLVVGVVSRRGDDAPPPPSPPVVAAVEAPADVGAATAAEPGAPPPQSELAAAPPVTGDGVLGNEAISPKVKAKEKTREQGKTQSMATRGSGEAVEKVPYAPEWEQRLEQDAAPTAEQQTLYSPSPFRYQLAANDAEVLRRIAEIAKALGGRLEDARGRPLAPYEMEQGDMRSVRIVVPSYREAELSKRLRELGSVTAVNGGSSTLVKPGADVPVLLDVNY